MEVQKQHFIDLTEEDSGVSIYGHANPVRTKEVGPVENGSGLIMTQKEGSELKREDKGVRKHETKQTSKSGAKVFIKATKSRLPEEFMAEMKNDASAYAWNITTYVDQASREPDFIGNAFYYNLCKPALHQDLAGEYVIVYSRPMGAKFDRQGESTTIPPGTQNKITIITQTPRGNSENTRNIERTLLAGYWAVGSLSLCGHRANLNCEKVPNNRRNFKRHIASVRVHSTGIDFQNFDEGSVPEQILRETGSNICFGIKVMNDLWDERRGKYTYLGFHFLQMEISWYNSLMGKTERHLVVGVKIPTVSEGNIASSFILKQNFFNPRDTSILDSDERVRELAEWHTYAATEIYRERNPAPGWSPHTSIDLGLRQMEFDASKLEQHLCSYRDPMRELSNIIVWLSRFLTDGPVSREDHALHEAHQYMENRLEGMKGEQRLREEAGGLREPLPISLELPAEPRQSMQDSLKLGDIDRSERGEPLADRTNRRLGHGGVTLPTPIIWNRRE